MLSQIEVAFAERTASEARLRRFVADASHELRTPLTSIRGYAELFRRGASSRPDDLAKTMRRIEEAAARMGVLVDDLLLLARLDQGRPLDRGPVDLTAPRRRGRRRPPRDVARPPGRVRLRRVDRRERRRVPVAAGAREPARERAHAHAADHAGRGARDAPRAPNAIIEVRDHGPGMTAEDAARAFERFWRSDPSRTRSSGGAGLGLAIVAAITQAHGGHAEVETAPGAGATFRVWHPAHRSAAERARPRASRPPMPSSSSSRRSSPRARESQGDSWRVISPRA